ncbi:expressed unknown protein [Seminavis robusta]|uniref:Uncharacterized protein n=1 Tax=Seminavis robusta TaxID=568900 RepID=A0A9N8ENS1_9STRA|nr:expressed unknown protein [Seminavis robusta]|eukprot:Sro1249_g255960.1 n/a (119) ;mRNA; r:3176-3532
MMDPPSPTDRPGAFITPSPALTDMLWNARMAGSSECTKVNITVERLFKGETSGGIQAVLTRTLEEVSKLISEMETEISDVPLPGMSQETMEEDKSTAEGSHTHSSSVVRPEEEKRAAD